MHIPEGALGSSPAGLTLLGAGFALTGLGTAIGLSRMDQHRVPRVAMLSSAFFVASLVMVPVGPTYVHPVFNGLMGLILGWAAFPALLVALLLQAVFFQFGGLTTLGLNTLNMALPAIICCGLFARAARSGGDRAAFAAATGAGFLGVALAALMMAGSLVVARSEYSMVGGLILVSELATAVVEGLITASVVLFLRKVRPELLDMLPLSGHRPKVGRERAGVRGTIERPVGAIDASPRAGLLNAAACRPEAEALHAEA